MSDVGDWIVIILVAILVIALFSIDVPEPLEILGIQTQ